MRGIIARDRPLGAGESLPRAVRPGAPRDPDVHKATPRHRRMMALAAPSALSVPLTRREFPGVGHASPRRGSVGGNVRPAVPIWQREVKKPVIARRAATRGSRAITCVAIPMTERAGRGIAKSLRSPRRHFGPGEAGRCRRFRRDRNSGAGNGKSGASPSVRGCCPSQSMVACGDAPETIADQGDIGWAGKNSARWSIRAD
jgi:hypothetical protein